MSLQQASAQQRGAGPEDGAAAAGGSGEPRPSRAGREPLSPASDASEHKRRRTSGEVTADLETNASTNAERDAAARTDAAADLEEAIRRSLRDANDTAERPAVGSAPRDGQIRGGGEPRGAPPRTAPAIDAAALAAAFAAAAASTSSAGHAGSRRTNTANVTSGEDRADEAREDEKAAHERGSGVPVRRPELAGADEAWWRDDDDDDDDDDASRTAGKSASVNRVPEISVACSDEESATALLTELLGCAVVRADALAKTKTLAGIPIPFAGGPGLTKKVLDAALASRN